MKILKINAGARREGANATRPGNQIVSGLRALDPSAGVTVRDLAVSPDPVLDDAALGSLFAPAE
ncbi:MAG: azoR [Proteobacteria bacterium]|nr:azoR [Pseudomonadota bacterium]